MKTSILVPAALAALTAFYSFKAHAEEPKVEPAVVACNVPLTGPHAVYGASIEEAVTFAQEEMGAEKASHIRYDWDDNRSDPKEAVSVLRRQLPLHPAIYLSGVKPEYMAIHDLLAAKNIPH